MRPYVSTIFLIFCMILVSCQTLKARNYKARSGRKISVRHVYLVWGATESNEGVPCEHGIERISEGSDIVDFLVTFATFGFVTMQSAEIRCAAA
jgi:hypothetical protein